MSDLGYGTETAEPAVASGSDAGDNSWHGADSAAAMHDRDSDAFAAEDQFPARQDSRAATWDDDLGYDEAGLPGNADDDLDGLTDRLAPQQDAYDVTWGDNPQWDEAGMLGADYRNPYDEQEAPAEGDDGTADLGPQPTAGERGRSTAPEAESGKAQTRLQQEPPARAGA